MTQNAEIAARYDGYGVLAAIGWPGYWNQFGYIRSSEFGVTPAFEITPEFFMVKELYRVRMVFSVSLMNGNTIKNSFR